MAEIIDFRRRDRDRLANTGAGQLRGADEAEFAFIGQHEDDATVVVLQDVRLRAVVEAGDHDMAPLYQPKIGFVFGQAGAAQDSASPRPRRIYENARRGFRRHTFLLGENPPVSVVAPRRAHLGTGRNLRAGRCGVARIENDQPGIFYLAIRVYETRSEMRL